MAGTIGNGINPGVFFYYTKIVTTTANQVVTVTESHTGTVANFTTTGMANLFTANCGSSTGGTLTPDNTGATWTIASPGTYIIGIKYDVKSISGTPAPVPHIITYTFTTTLGPSTSGSVLLTDNKLAVLTNISDKAPDVTATSGKDLPATTIPTLSDWALLLLGLLVGATGWAVLRQRRQM